MARIELSIQFRWVFANDGFKPSLRAAALNDEWFFLFSNRAAMQLGRLRINRSSLGCAAFVSGSRESPNPKKIPSFDHRANSSPRNENETSLVPAGTRVSIALPS